MTQISEREACTKRSWYMGGAIGLLVAFLLLAFGMAGLLMAIVVGALVGVIAGYLLMTLLCKDVPAEAPQDNSRSAAAASAAAAPTASGSVSSATGTVPAGDAGIGAARKASAPVEPKPEASENATRDEAATAPIADAKVVEAAPEDVQEAEEGPAAQEGPKAAAEDAGKKDTGAEATEAKAGTAAEAPATRAADDGGKPPLLDAPRAEGADDLKKIGGIGPKIEQTLNELGIYHYDQLANLSGDEIEWVDSRLRFKGRIERDDWVGQASALADAKAKG